MTVTFSIAARTFTSRLIVGTGKYPSHQIMRDAHVASGTEMVTVAVRRVDLSARGEASLLSWVDRDRCLDAAERAVAVASRVEGSLASAHARGYRAYLNLLFRGWSDADERANAPALTAARARGEPALVTFQNGGLSGPVGPPHSGRAIS